MNRPTFICFVCEHFMLAAIETFILVQEPGQFIFDSAATTTTISVNVITVRSYARKLSTLNCNNEVDERLIIVLL
jgi:hypothetical protein